MVRFAIAAAALLGWAGAQDFTGVYAGQATTGPVEVELVQQGDALRGVLTGPGVRVELEGYVAGGIAFGRVAGDDDVEFEGHLQGDTLGLFLYEPDQAGNPVPGTVIELLLTRRQGTATPPVGQPAPAPGGDPLVGTFADDRLTLEINAAAGGYTGEIRSGGQTFVLEIAASATGVTGRFQSGGQSYAFTASLEGSVMVFVTAGTTYRLQRQEDPFAAQPGPAPVVDDIVLANGAYAVLTQDNATAFIEALEFVLAQLGYAYRFSDSERLEALRAIAQSFPGGAQTDQLVLADARNIWTRAEANWSRASEREQREFALGVLILAFGEETVRQWVGPGGAGGGGQAMGGGTCTTFEDCTSRFVDQRTWNDTHNTQGCWAAAGCEGYDTGTGTFTYNDDY